MAIGPWCSGADRLVVALMFSGVWPL